MFQIVEKIRAQSPDDLRGQELGRVASVHFLFSQLPEKSYHRNGKQFRVIIEKANRYDVRYCPNFLACV